MSLSSCFLEASLCALFNSVISQFLERSYGLWFLELMSSNFNAEH